MSFSTKPKTVLTTFETSKGRKLRVIEQDGKARIYDAKDRKVGPEFESFEGVVSYAIRRGWSI